MRGAPRRLTGAFSALCRCSATVAAISAPKPATDTASCTTSRRPVFSTLASTRALSHGHRVRRSRTSASMPFLARASAAVAHDARLAERHQFIVAVGHLALESPKVLVLHVDDGVVAADRGLHQRLI